MIKALKFLILIKYDLHAFVFTLSFREFFPIDDFCVY